MPAKRTILLASLAAAAVLLLFTAGILPVILKKQVIAVLEQETGRKAAIEAVTVNPFTLTVTASGCRLEAGSGGSFVSIGRIRASLGLASIYRRALILSEVTIDAPAVSFTRLAANTYSFSDIIRRVQAKPKQTSPGKALFSINNITVRNGSIDFDDRLVEGGRLHSVRNLDISVPFISTMPYLANSYIAPHLSATVNGARFAFNGRLKPMSTSREASLHIDLKGLDLPRYAGYSPVPLPVTLDSGRVSVTCDVTYRVSSREKPELTITGATELEALVITMRDTSPLLRIPALQAGITQCDVINRRYLFDRIAVDGLELFVNRAAGGDWMFRKLLERPLSSGRPAPPQETAPENAPPRLQLKTADFRLTNGRVHFSDAAVPGGFSSDISGITAAIRNFDTSAATRAEFELALNLDRESTLSSSGTFSPAPVSVSSSSSLTGYRLQRLWPYLSQYLTAPVTGRLSLSSRAAYDSEHGFTIEDGQLQADDLSAHYGAGEAFNLARLQVRNIGYTRQSNAVSIGDISLTKGSAALSREGDGRISLFSLFRQAPSPGLQTTVSAAAGQQADNGISYRIGRIRLEKFNTSFTDRIPRDMPRFTLNDISLNLSGLNGPRFTPAEVNFSAQFNSTTPLKARGELTPAPFRYKGSLSLGRLPLRAFEAYFPSDINVFLLDGSVDSTMSVDLALRNGRPTGSFRGSAGIRSFYAIDTEAEEDLLKWESLQFDDMQGTLDPFSLNLRQIALNNVFSRLIIRKDGTLNLQNLIARPAQVTSAAVPAAVPAGAAETRLQPPPATSAPRNPVRIDNVTVQDGTLSFSDNHLPQHYSTTFFNLGGRISGLSSEESKFADVDLRGNLENHSPLQITGQINPLRNDLFVNLKVSFKDIELSPVTPYSGTYLGYSVEKGKLYLDLKYHIENRLLNSENRIFIDQFTFGEKVDSDRATALPVKLGLALLKDRNGEIHLDVPVTGRTDDPRFSIWRLAFQVLRNLLVKAVTSPFALLSSLAGGGDDFNAVQFSHGISSLPQQEQQKLAALAKALRDRPALKMELKGYVDREKDSEEYRHELLDRKLRNERIIARGRQGAGAGMEKADPAAMLPEERRALLAAVYKKEKFPKPRNVLGFVKDLPPEEMEKLILANTVIGEPELRNLARERVVAVMNALVAQGVESERLFQKNDDLFRQPAKDSLTKSRVELNAIVQ